MRLRDCPELWALEKALEDFGRDVKAFDEGRGAYPTTMAIMKAIRALPESCRRCAEEEEPDDCPKN